MTINTLSNVNGKGSGCPSQRIMFNHCLNDSHLGMEVKFAEGGKLEYPKTKPQSQIEINQLTDLHHAEMDDMTDDHYANPTPLIRLFLIINNIERDTPS